MKSLYESLKRYCNIIEGGMAGHMAHPIDFSDFTAYDLKELITDLFEGRIEDITEKISIYSNESLMILIQASMSIFAIWIFVLIINFIRTGLSLYVLYCL